jgi:hypothetical protein
VLVALEPEAAGSRAPILVQPAQPPAAPGPEAAPSQRRGPSLGVWILGGAGLVAATVGIIIRVHERSIYDEAAGADPIQVDRGNEAREGMKVGTAVAGVGLGALAGAALWWSFSF